MANNLHGLSIGISRVDNKFFLKLKITGKLTHQDYETITPMIDSALAEVKQPKINALVDITELDGWEIRAAWDDFKLGLKHGSEFEKIALIGNKKWQEAISKLSNWFTSGEIKYFEKRDEGVLWLSE